tara:strand:+ start:34 stop:459 length:426 start_codon:yes stop_codon:yes gene_type:complete
MIGKKGFTLLVSLILVACVVLASLVFVLSVGFVQAECDGYEYQGKCYVIGSELQIDGVYYYVDIGAILKEQKSDGLTCQNNFECLNNLCSNGACVNLYGEVEARGEGIAKVDSDKENVKGVGINIELVESRFGFADGVRLK